MLRLLVVLFAAPAAMAMALAKPQQIRSCQDPVFHYYLQAYPKNSELRAAAASEDLGSLTAV